MKQLNRLFPSMALTQARGAFLAGLAALAVVAVCSSGPISRAEGKEPGNGHHGGGDAEQVAALDQLLADFHGSLSYGGNINAMMELWTADSSITLNGVSHVGKTAVMTFFTTSGYFLNNWVSLAPEYKTQISIHGDRAEASTQCVAVDLSVTPFVVKSVIQVNATMVRQHGAWYFTSMNNTSPAPL